jgi:hypothetical protein
MKSSFTIQSYCFLFCSFNLQVATDNEKQSQFSSWHLSIRLLLNEEVRYSISNLMTNDAIFYRYRMPLRIEQNVLKHLVKPFSGPWKSMELNGWTPYLFYKQKQFGLMNC